MKKFLCILTILLFGINLWAGSFSSSHSSFSSSRSYSTSSPSRSSFQSQSYKPSTNYNQGRASYSSRSYNPSRGNTVIHNYNSSYNGNGFTNGLLTGVILTSIWNNPNRTVVYNNQSYVPYQGGYVDRQGYYYTDLEQPSNIPVNNPVITRSDRDDGLVVLVILLVIFGCFGAYFIIRRFI